MQVKERLSLDDVDVSQVTLVQLVRFIERMRSEFPVAIRVLAKRLYIEEYGQTSSPNESTFDIPDIDEQRVINSLHNLKDAMQHEMAGTLILSLHNQFGFGKVRVLRLWGQAKEMLGSDMLAADELAAWCEARGIDYDATFGVKANAKVD